MNSDYEYLHIKGAKENDLMNIYTISGQKINFTRIDAETILTGNLSIGVYLLEIISNNTKFRTKLIKE
jgi:hypothetical protein